MGRIVAMTALLSLSMGIMTPMVASADENYIVSLPVKLELTKSHAYVGDDNWPYITVKTLTPKDVEGRDEHISLFDLETGDFRGYCLISRETEDSCDVYIDDNSTVFTPEGEHQFIATSSLDWVWESDTQPNINLVDEAISKSLPITFTRLPLQLTLSADSAYFDGYSGGVITAKLNQYANGGEDYSISIFDMTTGELWGSTGALSDETYAIGPRYSFGDPHEYQAFLAKQPRDNNGQIMEATSISQLTDIQATSNIYTLSRSPWAVTIEPWGEDGVDVRTEIGGGEYGTYLVDNNNGNIIWNDLERNTPLFAPNPYHIEDVSWATAYVARTWFATDGGNGIKPLKKSDLLDIQADSNGYVKRTSGATIDMKEIAGGYNPSEPCSQGCQGDPINMGTGEFFDGKTDLIASGAGLKAVASRGYSTTNKGELSSLGYGWRSNYEMGIASNNGNPVIANDNNVTITQENGSIVTFHKDANGNYETGPKTQATLTYDVATAKFTLVREKKETFVFNAMGKLINQKDIFGNVVTIAYNGNKISTVTDTYGNVLTYVYTANLLTSITDQNGQSVTYGYNATKKVLTSVTDSNGVLTKYTYDTNNRVKTLTNALGGITTNTYDYADRITQQKDPLGRLLKFAYDGDPLNQTVIITQPDLSKSSQTYTGGQLSQMVESIGPKSRTWKYIYGTTNQVIATINPDNTITGSQYDSNGNMLSTTDEKGNRTTFTYDGQNNLLTIKDALGATTTNTYDTHNLLLSSMNALGYVSTFEYNADGTLKKSVDARGNVTNANPADFTSTYAYTTKDLLTETVDPIGNKTKISFDALGRAISTISPKGFVTGNTAVDHTATIAYNSLNLPSKVKAPNGGETNLSYDGMGNVLTSRDALNNVTTNTYDIMGNLLTVTNALHEVTTYAYDKMNRVVSITDAKGKVSTIKYDVFGHMVETVDPLGRVVKQEWNNVDMLTATIDADGNRTEYAYDHAGNLAVVKDALGNVTKYSYDKLNRIVKTVDSENRVTLKEYDVIGQLSKTTNADGTIETLAYDAVGNVIGTTNAMGKTQSWAYDASNRKTSYTNENNEVTSYVYDANSNLKTETRSDNSVVTYGYNNVNMVTSVDYPGVDSDITYTYDILGKIASEKKGSQVATTYSYDALGRVTTRGPPNSKVAYTYDAVGNISTLSYPSGRVVTYGYDDASQMSAISTQGITNVGIIHNTRGLVDNTTLPNGISDKKSYDVLGRLVGTDVAKNTTSLYKKTQTYTNTSNVSQQSTTTGTVSPRVEDYAYDPLSRLTEQKDNTANSVTNSYGYNGAGNLTIINGNIQAFDDSGKILSSGTQAFSYDGLINRVSNIDNTDSTKSREYAWNIDNSLENVTTHEGVTPKNVSYTYDSMGLLLSRSIDNTVTNTFTWDTNNNIPLMLSDGVFEYVYDDGRVPLAQVRLSDGGITYLHKDLNGSVTASTSPSGDLLGTTTYSPYGVPENAPQSNFGYAGEWTDNTTNHVYLRARWYDVSTGSFLSMDPLVQITGNSYGYTNGNPITQVDPLGLFSLNPLDMIQDQIISPIAQKVDNAWNGFTDGVNKVTKTIVDGSKPILNWTYENSGYIGAGLGIVAIGLSVTGVGAPVGAVLGYGALFFGGMSTAYEASKCLGKIENGICNPAAVALSALSLVTGGIGTLGKHAILGGMNTLSMMGSLGGAMVSGIDGIITCAKNKNLSKEMKKQLNYQNGGM